MMMRFPWMPGGPVQAQKAFEQANARLSAADRHQPGHAPGTDSVLSVDKARTRVESLGVGTDGAAPAESADSLEDARQRLRVIEEDLAVAD